MIEVAEPAGAGDPDGIVEPVEAVIITGPRRGEIIRLPGDAIPEISDDDIKLLNGALDQLIAAIDRYSATVRAGIRAFSEESREH